ncbi:collagen-like protein [Zhongshania sp.]|jgi:hypothetical protein|uniref:collagen-like protein n=1 Tax=Zhongshania sp. TaxID=1971902 RepID=UPI002A80B9B1|nr:collagen-like protein [Zhongshania sp.]
MKYLATMALALVPLTSMATDLIIPAGQAYLVGIDQQELILDKLNIGDDARISFAPGVNSWRVHARLANIGKNVVIDGRGSAGQNGAPGMTAPACDEFVDGQPGESGQAGNDGVEVRLQLALESLGSMEILSAGGDGGLGGAGGDGADLNTKCDAEVAGEGGNGGDGGEGGRGGDVTFLYQSVAKTESGDSMVSRLSINADGGAGGEGGDAGSGGAGGGGRYAMKKSLTGSSRKWVGGAAGGLAGSPGSMGSAGKPGRILLDQLIMSTVKVAPSNNTASVKALQREIEALRKRVEKLEARQGPESQVGVD